MEEIKRVFISIDKNTHKPVYVSIEIENNKIGETQIFISNIDKDELLKSETSVDGWELSREDFF